MGMFIAELDRPWKDTPFPPDGFHIRRTEDLETLKLFSKEVVVDTTRGVAPRKQRHVSVTILSSARNRSPEAMKVRVNHDAYTASKTVKQELDNVERLYHELGELLSNAISAARNDQRLHLEKFSGTSRKIRESVIRCPDAMIWFLNTNSQENCLLKHSQRAALWAVLLARHMGFSAENMQSVFMGTLLADIGMAKFPEELVRKTGSFSRREYLAYQKHVRISEDILRIEGDVDKDCISIVRCHHERHDGLGFPRGQRGDQIPVMARIAHLAYCFDRLLRHGAEGVIHAPANAASRLYKQRKLKFTEQLVFEFIQILGTYPAGTLVELASRELAVVIEQVPNEKLSPKMALITDDQKQPLKKPRLFDPTDGKQRNENRTVLKALDSGSYGVVPERLRDAIFGKRIGIGKLGIRI